MKSTHRYFALALLTVFVLVLGACAPAAPASSSVAEPAAPAVASGGGEASPVEFTGVIQAIEGSQWTINGQAINVDAQALAGSQFAVGDTVRVKGQVAADGFVTASQVSVPGAPAPAAASSTTTRSSADTTGSTSSTGTDANSNSSDANSNSTDDNSNGDPAGEDFKVTGTVEAIDGNQITVGGVTYTVAEGVDLSGIVVGDVVTLEVLTNADGTQTVTEVQSGDDASDDNSNGSDDNSNDSDDNSNDDDSNDNDSNDNDDDDNDNDDDDNGNEDNSNG